MLSGSFIYTILTLIIMVLHIGEGTRWCSVRNHWCLACNRKPTGTARHVGPSEKHECESPGRWRSQTLRIVVRISLRPNVCAWYLFTARWFRVTRFRKGARCSLLPLRSLGHPGSFSVAHWMIWKATWQNEMLTFDNTVTIVLTTDFDFWYKKRYNASYCCLPPDCQSCLKVERFRSSG